MVHISYFHCYLGKISNFTSICSDGLVQPPTSLCWVPLIHQAFCSHENQRSGGQIRRFRDVEEAQMACQSRGGIPRVSKCLVTLQGGPIGSDGYNPYK